MAATILYTIFVCLLISAVFSLPCAKQHDSTLQQSSDSARANEFTEKSSELDVVSFVSHEKSELETKAVRTLDGESSIDAVVAPSFDANRLQRLRRPKRQVIGFHGCPHGMIGFANQCMSFEKYERLLQGDEEET